MNRILLRKTSLVDYPGKVAAALFLPGCNLRCPWCQNRELVLPGLLEGRADLLTVEEAAGHLLKRRSVLGGAVLSGGEPTASGGLEEIIRRVKALGLPVKLDTNGMNPGVLESLFSRKETRPDYVSLDLKLPPERYGELMPRNAPLRVADMPDALGFAGFALKTSADLIRASGIDHEFRTLALPNRCLDPDEIPAMAALVDGAPWYFRTFRPGNCLDPAWDSLDAPGGKEAAALALNARKAGKQGIAL